MMNNNCSDNYSDNCSDNLSCNCYEGFSDPYVVFLERKPENIKEQLAYSAALYIHENYKKRFSLDTLAENLFFNKYYLLRIFKEISGITLLSYHNYVRCLEAEKLLAGSNLSIAEAGSECGFATPAHFSRIFKKVTGATPKEFRKKKVPQ